jgi:hypothetical protein
MNMKNFIFTIIFISSTFLVWTQSTNTPATTNDPINGSIHYAITANHTQQINGSYTSIGGDAWIPMGKRYTLNYNFRLGFPTNGGIYLHASDGIFLGGLILGNFGDYKVLSTIGFLMLFIPEGVGYYIGNGPNRLHLSINPLTIDYRYRNVPNGEWATMGGNITARWHIPTKKNPENFISPFIGLAANYDNTHALGVRAGVSLGFHQ